MRIYFNKSTLEGKKRIRWLLWEWWRYNTTKSEKEKHMYKVSFLSWCCFLYKKNIVHQPFIDFYMIYAEDSYLSQLLISKWYKMAICTKSIVYHLGSATMWRDPSSFKLFHGNKNQIINFLLFLNKKNIIKLLPIFCIVQLSHIFVNAPIKRLRAKGKAWIWIIKNRGNIMQIRKKILNESIINNDKFLSLFSCKFNEPDSCFKTSWLQKKIIPIINYIFKLYYNILKINYYQ